MDDLSAIEGRKFGCWTVIEQAKKPEGIATKGRFWLCRCDCGNQQILSAGRMNAGRGTRSCKSCFGHGHARSRSLSPTYNSWRGMRERCNSPNHVSYSRYGGRGISVCEKWSVSFPAFLKDMGERPKGMSLDRINPDADYSPDNCRWATVKQQSTNTVRGALSDEQRVAILELYKGGATARLIADAVGVARGTVSAIASGAGFSKRVPK